MQSQLNAVTMKQNWTFELLYKSYQVFPIEPDKFFNHSITYNRELNLLQFTLWFDDRWHLCLLNDDDLKKEPLQLLNEIKDNYLQLNLFEEN